MKRRNPFEKAIEYGRASFRDGLPKTANPYDDKRKICGRLTWSRAWLKAWDDGWDEAKKIAEARHGS